MARASAAGTRKDIIHYCMDGLAQSELPDFGESREQQLALAVLVSLRNLHQDSYDEVQPILQPWLGSQLKGKHLLARLDCCVIG